MSPPKFLSDEQTLAAAGRGDRLIEAAAGAGKTRVLVHMVTDDLLGGMPEDEIMVTTFTRRAAGELAQRIGSILIGRRLPMRIDVSRVWLATMDSCFADLLREAALALGLPPSVRIAQGHELEAQRDVCLERARSLCSGVLADLDRALPLERSDLANLVSEIFGKAIALGLDPRALKTLPAEPLPDLAGSARRLGELAQLVGGSRAANIRRDANALARGDLNALGTLRWGRISAALQPRASELHAEVLERLGRLADSQAEAGRGALAELVRAYASERLIACRASGLLGYDDATLLLWQGLQAGLVERRFARIYVDEAQDTNPAQRQIIAALAREDGERRLIGDQNQSIYSFRFADPTGFAALGTQMQGRTLLENYRTSPHLLAVVAAIAGAVSDPPLASQAAGMIACGLPRLTDPPARAVFLFGEGEVRVPEEAGAVVPEIERLRAELGIGNGEVAVLCRTNPQAQIYADALRAAGVPALCLRRGGILTASECQRVLEYLRCVADEDDLSALAVALAGPVADLGSEVARIFAGPREPLVILSSAHPAVAEAIARHRSWVNRMRPADLARRALEELGYLDACAALADGGIAERNVLGLIERIEQLKDRSLLQVLDDLLVEAETETDESAPAAPSPDTEAVQVMTMHGSKGLEFPLVVVACIGQYLGDRQPKARVDHDGRIGVQVRHAGATIGDATYLAAARAQEVEVAAEERRLLYVAMTRAQRGLMMVVSGKFDRYGYAQYANAADWMAPILLAGGALPPPGDREERALGEGRLEIVRLAPRPAVPKPSDRLALNPPVLVSGRPEGLVPAPAPASFTAISGWRRCGLRRHLERDLALSRADVWLEGGEGHAAFGRAMHAALRDADWGAPALEPMLSRFLQADRLRAEDQLRRLLGEAELCRRLAQAPQAAREVRFAIAGPPPLVGAMDVLIDEAHGALVIDWKTGEDAEEIFTADHALQQEIYALAVLSRPEAPSTCDCWWVHLGESPLRIERRAFLLHEREELGDRISQAIEACDRMTPAPAADGELEPFCQRCPGATGLCPGIASPA